MAGSMLRATEKTKKDAFNDRATGIRLYCELKSTVQSVRKDENRYSMTLAKSPMKLVATEKLNPLHK